MIVVADTGPLHYLVLIGAVDVLQPLYSRVLVPQTVAGELQETNTPAAVRAWIEQPPEWFEIRPDPPSEETLRFLDPGERAAIALALSVDAERPGEHAMSSSVRPLRSPFRSMPNDQESTRCHRVQHITECSKSS